MKLLKLTFVILICGMAVNGCTKDKTLVNPQLELNCTPNISFSTTIAPIIQQNCSTTDCHDAMAAGGYEFLSHTSISSNSERILRAIKHEANIIAMPYNLPKLSDSLIQKFECWVLQGKLDN